MQGHPEPGQYKDVVLFLATAGIVVPLFRRSKISPIIGFRGPRENHGRKRNFAWR